MNVAGTTPALLTGEALCLIGRRDQMDMLTGQDPQERVILGNGRSDTGIGGCGCGWGSDGGEHSEGAWGGGTWGIGGGTHTGNGWGGGDGFGPTHDGGWGELGGGDAAGYGTGL